jgi:hypothetical protein
MRPDNYRIFKNYRKRATGRSAVGLYSRGFAGNRREKVHVILPLQREKVHVILAYFGVRKCTWITAALHWLIHRLGPSSCT